MERLPPTTFGRSLRTLIRERFGTQARLAHELGVDASWITKVVRGSQEGLSYSSLQRILEAFSRPSDKDLLYEAWRESFAPSPTELAPSIWDGDERIYGYCGTVPELISAGKAIVAFRALQPIWSALQTRPARSEGALRVGHSLVDVANQLDRPSVSLEVAAKMREIALLKRELGWVATALGLESVSLRHLRPRRLAIAEGSFHRFGAYLQDWQPVSVEGRSRRTGLVRALSRDQLLVGLDAVQEGTREAEGLALRITNLESQLRDTPEGPELGLASEVLARTLVASGQLERAARALTTAARHTDSRANEVKVLICRAQLHIADGQLGEVEALLGKAAGFADEWTLIHHRHKIAEINRSLNARHSDRYILRRIRKE
ncbi:MAG: helix-turn-helix transcriptional regulator [Armatimonadetes bacterium]|nr:helix-turn-helix transcriptional regulator [Armatimonadota bacterium]